MMRQQKKKEEETAAEGIGRTGRFGKAVTEEKADPVKAIQQFANQEMERKRKEEEEKKKKKAAGVDTAPSKGIFERIYDTVMGTKEKK